MSQLSNWLFQEQILFFTSEKCFFTVVPKSLILLSTASGTVILFCITMAWTPYLVSILIFKLSAICFQQCLGICFRTYLLTGNTCNLIAISILSTLCLLLFYWYHAFITLSFSTRHSGEVISCLLICLLLFSHHWCPHPILSGHTDFHFA